VPKYTKRSQNLSIGHNIGTYIYQIAMKIPKWLKYNKIFRSKYSQVGILGKKIYHLATLLMKLLTTRQLPKTRSCWWRRLDVKKANYSGSKIVDM
jgi:hypothetical protein